MRKLGWFPVTFVAIGLLLGIFLSACGGGNPLIGKWQGDGETVEFKADGTWAASGGVGGTYRLTDASHVELESGGVKITAEFRLTGDQLTLIPPADRGSPVTLVRVK